MGPPRFGFFRAGLDGSLLCWRKIEFVYPSGGRALGQRAWEMSGQPGVGVAWNGEEILWFKCRWGRWSIGPCKDGLIGGTGVDGPEGVDEVGGSASDWVSPTRWRS